MPSSVDCQATRDSNPSFNEQGPLRSDGTSIAGLMVTTRPSANVPLVSDGTHVAPGPRASHCGLDVTYAIGRAVPSIEVVLPQILSDSAHSVPMPRVEVGRLGFLDAHRTAGVEEVVAISLLVITATELVTKIAEALFMPLHPLDPR